MADCIFCKIIEGKIPCRKVHEDAQCMAFYDVNPQTPAHVLVIPKKHIASISDATETDEIILGHLLRVAAVVAKDHKLDTGYRTVINTGEDAGQTVFHIHVHVLGGRPMGWPPG